METKTGWVISAGYFLNIELQCVDSEYVNDETYLMGYNRLERETGLSRTILRPEVLALRNEGIIELSPAVDADMFPNGSGYLLTEQGGKLAHQLCAPNQTHHGTSN